MFIWDVEDGISFFSNELFIFLSLWMKYGLALVMQGLGKQAHGTLAGQVSDLTVSDHKPETKNKRNVI